MMIFDSTTLNSFRKLLENAGKIVITAHKSPDGDSIGSSLGLYHYLLAKGYDTEICHPDPAPHFLHWMTGYNAIKNLEEHTEEVEQSFQEADLIFCLDYNSAGRIGNMDKVLTASKAPKVMIDHHRDPDQDFCQIMFSSIEASSTSELVYRLIEAMGDLELMNATIGTPLYAGIMTDTGSFRFPSSTALTHSIAAGLIEAGVKHWEVHENIFDTNSINRIQLVSYALLEKLVIKDDIGVAYITLTQEEEKRFNAIKGDTEGLVNQGLGIEGIKMSVFMKESDGIIKMSFRSKGSIPVNDLARNHFNGGGHLNAAGGKFVGSMENAIDKFVTILPEFVEKNKVHFG